MFFKDDDSWDKDIPVAEVVDHLEDCESTNLGGLMTEDIVAMCVADAVVDDDNHPVEKNILITVTNNNAPVQFEKWGCKGVCYRIKDSNQE